MSKSLYYEDEHKRGKMIFFFLFNFYLKIGSKYPYKMSYNINNELLDRIIL